MMMNIGSVKKLFLFGITRNKQTIIAIGTKIIGWIGKSVVVWLLAISITK